MHNQIARQEVGEDQPCADLTLLAPLKRSAEYRTIHPRLADIHPLDHWQQDGLHYFVFPLKLADGTSVAIEDAPVVIFTMHPEASAPVSVVVVSPSADRGDAEIVNLRDPESRYSLPLPAPVAETPPTETAVAATLPPAPESATVPGDGRAELLLSTADGKEPADDRLPADPALLGAVNASREYQSLRPRLADVRPLDDWQDEGVHYFVFQLLADGDAPVPAEDAPVAVFTMRPGTPEPVSVVVVTPGPDGEQVAIVSLRQPESGSADPLAVVDEGAGAGKTMADAGGLAAG